VQCHSLQFITSCRTHSSKLIAFRRKDKSHSSAVQQAVRADRQQSAACRSPRLRRGGGTTFALERMSKPEEIAELSSQRRVGIRLVVGGCVLGAIAFPVGRYVHEELAPVVFLLGLLTLVGGFVVHFRWMYRESRIPPHRLHKRSQQPWDK